MSLTTPVDLALSGPYFGKSAVLDDMLRVIDTLRQTRKRRRNAIQAKIAGGDFLPITRFIADTTSGASDSLPKLKEALRESARQGLPVVWNHDSPDPGLIGVSDAIPAKAGAALVMGPNVRIHKRFGSVDTSGLPLWQNPMGEVSDGFYLEGGVMGMPLLTDSYGGNIFDLKGDGITIFNTSVKNIRGIWGLFHGDDIILYGNKSRNSDPDGGGGCRFTGGARFLAERLDLHCSDDGLMASLGDTPDKDIINAFYIDCEARPAQGAMIASIFGGDMPPPPVPDKAIRNVLFAGITGAAGWNSARERGGYGVKIINGSGAQAQEVWFIEAEIARRDLSVPRPGVRILPIAGKCIVHFLKSRVLTPHIEAIRVEHGAGMAFGGVELYIEANSQIEAPATFGADAVVMQGNDPSSALFLDNVSARGNGGDIFRVASESGQAFGTVTASRCSLRGIAEGKGALHSGPQVTSLTLTSNEYFAGPGVTGACAAKRDSAGTMLTQTGETYNAGVTQSCTGA